MRVGIFVVGIPHIYIAKLKSNSRLITMKQGDTKDSSKAVMSGACAFEETQPAIPEVTSSSKEDSPTDGGWGWVVCAGVFVVNFLTVGQHNSAGVVYVAVMDEYSTPRGETGNPFEYCLIIFKLIKSFKMRTITRTRFSQYLVVREREPASFWREHVIAVVTLLRGLAKMS